MKILTLLAFTIFTFSLTSYASENERLTYNDNIVVKKIEMKTKLPTMAKTLKKSKIKLRAWKVN
jgi:hypothetical protein